MPHLRSLLAEAGIDATIELRRVEIVEDAERERFLGSPTVRIGGRDVDPGAAAREDFGMKCRLYATDQGMRGTPPDAWILAALASVYRRARTAPPVRGQGEAHPSRHRTGRTVYVSFPA